MGRFGQKTGAGWYRYEPGKRDAIPDPVVDEVIAAVRKEKGIAPRKISDEEIVGRCMGALASEGAKILAEGIAARLRHRRGLSPATDSRTARRPDEIRRDVDPEPFSWNQRGADMTPNLRPRRQVALITSGSRAGPLIAEGWARWAARS